MNKPPALSVIAVEEDAFTDEGRTGTVGLRLSDGRVEHFELTAELVSGLASKLNVLAFEMHKRRAADGDMGAILATLSPDEFDEATEFRLLSPTDRSHVVMALGLRSGLRRNIKLTLAQARLLGQLLIRRARGGE